MSSQGSSSVRICSGTSFAPMSGDPLSREASTPNASSTESALEVASRLVDKRSTKPMHEMTSTSGHFNEEEEEDEVAVSYEDL